MLVFMSKVSFVPIFGSSQQCLSQSRSRQRTSYGDCRFYTPLVSQSRIDFHDVKTRQTTSFCYCLADIMSLSESQTSSNGCAGAYEEECRIDVRLDRAGELKAPLLTSNDVRIDRIYIKAQMNRFIPFWIHMIQSHFNHTADPEFINFVHREALDVLLFENTTFGMIEVTKTDVDATGEKWE